MDLDKLITEARREYRKANVRLTVPQPPYQPSGTEYVRASSLGLCPLQHAYQKLKIEPDFPELTLEENTESAWIVDHGSYVAPMIQEPLMWYAMTHGNYGFIPEYPVLSKEHHLSGRLDGLLWRESDGESYILEIKDAEGQQYRSIAEPKLQYALQTLAYMMVTGISRAFIITCSKWGWNSFEILPQGDGFRLWFRDKIWEPPSWQENFNTPDILNFETVKAKIDEARAYAGIVAQDSYGDQLPAELVPIPDPLNRPLGWLCVHHFDKAKRTKAGKETFGAAVPNCPFAKRCHGLENRVYQTRKTDNGYEFV